MNIGQQLADKIIKNNQDYTIIPNPNFIFRKEIEEAIKNNQGYCCCATEKNEDTLCICKNFREQKNSGFCHCQRYYKIKKASKVCICGSTKFKNEIEEAAKEFSKYGCIVEMPNVFGHSGDLITEEEKYELDELHKSKIADCDLIYIINKDGYIGNSTASEIKWALSLQKEIGYLEN